MEYNGLLFSHRTNEILAFATTQMDLEGLVLTEVSQTKIHIVWYHVHVESKIYNKLVNITSTKKGKLIDKENKLAVSSWWGIPELGEWQVKTIGCNLGSRMYVQCGEHS